MPSHIDTAAARLGLSPFDYQGAVNPPVFHVSTVLFRTMDDYDARDTRRLEHGAMVYGLTGTPTGFALEDAVAGLEGGDRAVLTCSGLAAITTALLAFVKTGDHILVTDAAYEPTRRFCDGLLRQMGVETEFYDPRIGASIESLLRTNTRLIMLESPGSLTFEVQDTPAITAVAKRRGVITVLDNTWATPMFHRPLALGVDVSIHAATKYLSGHADVMLGVIVTGADHHTAVKTAASRLGQGAGPDDVYLTLRGLRTLPVRLRQHQRTALALAERLAARPEVERVLHPGLPTHPDHALWRRDFDGASGLFGMLLKPAPRAAVSAMVDGLELFGIGASWGGFQSLIVPAYPERLRTATHWDASGPLLRIHAGLEAIEDLIADLEAGFDRLNRAR